MTAAQLPAIVHADRAADARIGEEDRRVSEHRWRLGLGARLAIVTSILVTAMMGITAYLIYTHERAALEHGLASNGTSRAFLLSRVLAEPLALHQYPTIQELLAELDEMGTYTILTDDTGATLACAGLAKSGAELGRGTSAAVLLYFRSPRAILSKVFTHEVFVPKGRGIARYLEFAAPVSPAHRPLGYVRVGFDAGHFVQGPIDEMQRHIASIFLPALGVAVVVALLLSSLLVRPLKMLAGQAALIAAGRYDQPLIIRSPGEIADLTAAFDVMRRSIQEHIRQIQAANRQLDRKVFELETLYEVSSTLNYKSYSPELLNYLLDVTLRSLSCAWGSVMLLTDDADRLEIHTVRGASAWDPSRKVTLPIGQGIAGIAFSSGQPVVANTGSKDPRFSRIPGQEGFAALVRSIASVPLLVDQKPIGVLNVVNKAGESGFSPDDERLLVALAGQAARALESAKLYEMTIRESKTGLYVPSYFQARVQEQITTSRRFGQVFALLILDVDFFKQVNDRYGHLVGDDVLLAVSRFIKETIRQEIDIPCRFGGEEFTICLPRTDVSGAVTFAERLRRRIEEETNVPGGPDRVTASIGVAVYPDHATTLSALEKAADAALYAAKNGGRNQVRVAATPSGEGEGKPAA